MGTRIKRLFNSLELSATSPGSAVFVATAYTMFTQLTICNNDGTARTVSIYIVRNGGEASLDDAEFVVKTRTIAPAETAIIEEMLGHVLNPGDELFMLASAAGALTGHGSGLEVDP